MIETTDYYTTLGVDASASAEAIKQAYRRLALAFHPDHNPGDAAAETRFREIQTAYEALVDPTRRTAYDRARSNPLRHASFPGASFHSGVRNETPTERTGTHSDVFSFFFNDESHAPARGADIEAQLQLTFDQALRGGTTELPVHGGEPVRLVIPRGVRTGVKIRVSGRGKAAEGHAGAGAAGDLFVTLRVDVSPRFRREGDHLHIVETVSAIEAILGTARSITNAYGQTIRVAIPAGTQPGERLRLRGQGVVTDKRVGDLFVEVNVMVPRELTDEQRAELERTAQRMGLF
ncbi:MAG TPA: DnaJ C-terminal domain-containing protein [Rubricoccaceae bacterium]|jgi:molecular chaperone DnaJ/curved DNA-binding protein